MPTQHLAQPGVLLGHANMPPSPHLHSQLFQLPNHSRRLRLPLDHELSTSSCPAVVGESQEVESLWSSPTRLRSSLSGEPPKLDQSSLALIERQAKLGQSLPERYQQPSRIILMLGSNDTIVGVPHDHDLAARIPLAPLVYPGIKAVVQEDVG